MFPGSLVVSLVTCLWLTSMVIESRQISDATNEFSTELLKKLIQGNSKNVVFSPISVYTLLAILQQGAHGNSREEITNVLHSEPSQTLLGYFNFTKNYLVSDSLSTIRPSGRVSIGQVFSTLPEFYNRTVKNYLSVYAPIFFFTPESGEGYVSWITAGLNNSAVTELAIGDQDDSRFLSFSNKISFNSSWQNSFEEQNITFSPAPGQELQVPGIFQEVFCAGGISKKLGAKWILLNILVHEPSDEFYAIPKQQPWSDKDLSLLVMLPTTKHGLNNLLVNFKYQQLSRFFSYKSNKLAKVLLPEIELNVGKNLIPALREAGLKHIFNESANLSGITKYQLEVSRIYSKVHFSIDKFGVRTWNTAGTTHPHFESSKTHLGESFEFNADHPFLFFVLDRTNFVPIIAGRFADPSI